MISFKEGEKFAEAESINFFETSALSLKNIKECFNYIISQILIKSGIVLEQSNFLNNKESNKKCVIY